MNTPRCAALLVRMPPGANAQAFAVAAAKKRLRAKDFQFELEPLFEPSAPKTKGPSAAAEQKAAWYVARPTSKISGAHAWSLAHASLRQTLSFSGGGRTAFVEPDLEQWLDCDSTGDADKKRAGLAFGADGKCEFEDQNKKPGFEYMPNVFAWHLGPAFAQLKAAREAAGEGGRTVRIAHLDTGYDPRHATCPPRLNKALQRNFVNDQDGGNAQGNPDADGLLFNPSHGTGTLSILAGNRFEFSHKDYDPFDDFVGGAPQAEIVPLRVGRGVVQFWTSTIAAGINHAVKLCENEATRIHVMSMSMGGVASRAWADAVNDAYDNGIVYVSAAGNNKMLGIFPVPTRFIVYPARFRRVLAACGVMAGGTPYYGLPSGSMQGNFGPASKMATAMSAYTPNISWAKMGCPDIVRMNGEGTSSATPQIAAAAALYLQKHGAALFNRAKYPELWMRVEAVRHALFLSANHFSDGGSTEKLGNGILRANDALQIAPIDAGALRQTPRDNATFAFLKSLTGLGFAGAAAAGGDDARDMLMLEATQLFQQAPRDDSPNPFEAALPDPDVPAEAVTPAQRRSVFEIIESHPNASVELKAFAKKTLSAYGGGKGKGALSPSPSSPKPQPPTTTMPATSPSQPSAPSAPAAHDRAHGIATPTYRRLRAYSLDPGLSLKLSTVGLSCAVLNVPWEDLEPGPAGEYIEVIDADPSTGCVYYPADLNNPRLLAQDGYQPSEGTPQFHQQMTYAVASITIKNFERALGRRALWRCGPPQGDNPHDDSLFVRRLRIYPHALRAANAYYSPQKVALLFGYFNAVRGMPGEQLPGGLVFSCLSHDIIAHETAHALLDGMNRSYLMPTNPDVHAFHEAFADIVALFQHFTFPDIVRHQLAAVRGALRTQQTLLGEMAQQFAQGTGRRSALRSALGEIKDGVWAPRTPDPAAYATTTEPHARGSLLVAAVFEAFISIYENRTADLVRLASKGTGILRPGAIHPDLVNRLADEVTKSAQHVFTMCVRALDYCPPVDITFGEFLRALITADVDTVQDDNNHYRVAFIQAFQRHGLYPQDLRTLSVESLRWHSVRDDQDGVSAELQSGIDLLKSRAQDYAESQTRENVFRLEREMRRDIHNWLKAHFEGGAHGKNDARYLGLDPALSFEVRTARFANRTGPGGKARLQLIVSIHQRRKVSGTANAPDGGPAPALVFEGGSTLIADLRESGLRYCISKNVQSDARLERQRKFAAAMSDNDTTYPFSRARGEPFADIHHEH